MIPVLAAAAASKIAGPLVGGMGQYADVGKGMEAYNNYANQGTSTLNAGKEGANAAFNPYTSAGATANGSQLSAIQNRQQATNPALTNTSPSGVADYLNPSAAYSQNQAMKQAQAAGVAGGAMGGGMLKALSNNANQMAQTNYNNAYSQMLGTNDQNFNQQQQQYTNNNNFQQQQIGNYGDVANRGLSATSSNQGLNLQYNQGMNNNYMDQAANEQSGWNKKGEIFNKTSSDFGKNLGGGMLSVFGG
jgi:hypothetical protein